MTVICKSVEILRMTGICKICQKGASTVEILRMTGIGKKVWRSSA